jgi:hypothetical protein
VATGYRRRPLTPVDQPQAVTVEADFSRGIVRDSPRSSIPLGGLYDCVDMLVDQPGLLRERGGTAYSGAAMTAANYCQMPFYADFSAGAKLIAVGDNNHLYEVGATTTDRATLGSGYVPVCPLVQVSDFVVIPNANGTSAPKKAYVSGGTLTAAALGGSPPAGTLTENYYGRVALAGGTALPRRIYFSGLPNPESTWDTANSYIDADHNVTGLCSLQGALLVFSNGYMERLSGYTPPPDTDMQIITIDGIGCVDARSIAKYEAGCVFANLYGVYLTNGVSFNLLTEREDGTGIGSYWRSLVSGYSASTWTIAGGVLGDHYVVSVMNGTTLQATLLCHIPSKRWVRLSNVKAGGFAPQYGGTPELHYADRASNRVIALAGIFSKSAAIKNDANALAVAGFVSYRMAGDGIGLKAYLDGRLTYNLTDAGTDDPTVVISVATGLNADVFYTVPEGVFTETTAAARRRFTVGRDAQSVNIKLTRSGAASTFDVHGCEVDVRPYPIILDGVGV